jgi:prevent-host-death family protein
MEVGIRDLRNHLSKYLAGVAQGDELVVTDHGQAVARILPVEVPRPIDRLVAEGLVHPAIRVVPDRGPLGGSKRNSPSADSSADQRR